MFTGFGRRMFGIVVPILLFSLAEISMAASPKGTDSAGSIKQPSSLTDRVRHELAMLPYLGVFDNLGFTIEDSNVVVLTGQVVRPISKSDAEKAVSRLQNVSKVVDKIEVLPLSPFDDAIRLCTYRAIFSRPGFEKYAIQAVSPIRIIVKNGHITLDGVVGSQLEKTMAEMAARSVPGAFSVTNNLAID